MIQTIYDLIDLIPQLSTFLASLLILLPLTIICAKSIKKHSIRYYWAFAILSFAFAIPIIVRALFGVDMPSLRMVPILGQTITELSSAAYFIHPMFVIIMYMGALSTKTKYVGQLMSIRKELSIIAGFPVVAHLAKRLLFTFPHTCKFFANYEESMASPKVVSELGALVTQSALFIGIVITILFFILWITSFDYVRKGMSGKKWKSIQRWSYLFYFTLFLQSVGLLAGGLIDEYAREEKQKQAIHQTLDAKSAAEGHGDAKQMQVGKDGKDGKVKAAKPSSDMHKKSPQIFDFVPSKKAKAWFGIMVYFLIYGSYLILRVRKAKNDKKRREARKAKI